MNSKYQKHEPSHEKFLKNADDFCVYTIRLLKDENICPKSARWLGAEEIVKITQRFHTEVHRANNIKVTNAEEKKMRHAAQVSAYSLIATLGEKMAFNARIYEIKVNILSGWLTQSKRRKKNAYCKSKRANRTARGRNRKNEKRKPKTKGDH